MVPRRAGKYVSICISAVQRGRGEVGGGRWGWLSSHLGFCEFLLFDCGTVIVLSLIIRLWDLLVAVWDIYGVQQNYWVL